MHGAPSVSCPVGRSRFGALLTAGLWLAGAVLLLVWPWQAGGWSWRQAAMACVLAAAAAWSFAGRAAGELQWDGRSWRLSGAAGSLQVALDLQRWLLVRWEAASGGPARWFWLGRSALPARWLDLRRAVYSPASTEAPPGELPGANP